MTANERARRYLEKLPSAVSGAGGHDSTFRAACCLVNGFALSGADALILMRQWNSSHCEPPWSERELQHKIKSALRAPDDKARGYLLGKDCGKSFNHDLAGGISPTWPARNMENIRQIGAEGNGLAELLELSPFCPEKMKADDYIDALFPDNPWLCVGTDQCHAETRRRAEHRGKLEHRQFIVPNPMTGPEGKSQTGRNSARCLNNTAPRRFLVIECDFTPKDAGGVQVEDLCAGVLIKLARFAPLVLAVYSGGKSIHGWFFCERRPEEKLRQFMSYAVSLGADRATWTRCQFVRMPEGRRDNGRRQPVYFFNPILLNE